MVWKNDQVSSSETEKILELAKKALESEGDFVELGCYKGDTSLLLAELIKKTEKKLWLYDSFEGLPEKRIEDDSVLGVDFRQGELLVTKRELKERFLRAGFRLPIIKKAWFSDLNSDDLPEKIAFAFLDGDFYQSIKDGLRLVQDKMGDGGVIIIHDYDNDRLPGVKTAVDEWLNPRNLAVNTFQSLAIIVN